MNLELSININEYVECELTEHGKQVMSKKGFESDFNDGTNFIKIQLWQLMRDLGDSLSLGSEPSIVGGRITIVANT